MPRYAGLRRPKGRGGLSVPRASNDNKMGIVKTPALPVTRRIGPINPAMPVPRPWVPPFSAPAELLVAATELAFYSMPNPKAAMEWTMGRFCRDFDGFGMRNTIDTSTCDATGRSGLTWATNPKNVVWDGLGGITLYTHNGTAGSYDYFKIASTWYSNVTYPEALPHQYPDAVGILPQPLPQPVPKSWPRPRCGLQPSISPDSMAWPQGNPDLPPFVDAQSAADAGFSPPSTAYTIKPNGKAKAKPMASPTGKPKPPGKGKKEPNKGQNLGKGGKAIWIGTGAASEAIDVMKAAHDALPDWAKPDKHRDAYGNATEDPVPTIPEMIDALVKHGSQIDTEQFMENLLNNQIEDFFYGGLSKGVKPFSQAIGHKTGLDRAAGAGGRNVEENEDDPLLPTVSLDASSCSIKISW